ncbi:GAF domain-containing sensor histidine kinase [Desulfonatronovibrio magnus]|uniref:GAF domain-containing sensor histidine kinase n=1 Tax=Desulfonatronovibrio magnus TaxID=698827 RepID=UPI00069866F4|nr:ATP-binding protein [Desulfonatronovibrio magnus]
MSSDVQGINKSLRDKAEDRLEQDGIKMDNLSNLEVQALIQDLRVHQIELELQNQELRNTQNQLESARDRFARLFNDAPVGYLIIDEKGIIAQSNQTFASMVGQEPYNLTGKPLAELMSPGDRPIFYSRFKAFFKNPAGKQLELGLQGKSSKLPVRCVGRRESVLHVQPENQSHQHLLLIINDFREQDLAERRQRLMAKILGILNDSQKLDDGISRILESIQEETGVHACGIRLRKGNDFPYYVHHGFSKEFLQAENTLQTRDAHGDVCRNPDGKPALECTCGLVLTGQTDPSNPLFTPNGSCWTSDSFPLLDLPESQDPRHHPRNTCIHHGYQSVALIPVRANQEIVGLIQLNDHRKGFFDRKLINFLEEVSSSIGLALMRLQDTQMIKESEEQLKILLTEKDKLFSIIAHDLKSPMAGLVSSTEMLAHQQDIFSQEDIRLLATELHKNARNTFALLEDLLQWARISQGGMDFSPKKCSLYELVRSSLYTAQDVAGRKDIAIKCEIPQDLTVLVDQPMINTVIRNVIFNAVKFTPQGGNISVTARKSGSDVKVYVQDDGIGMDEAIMSKIFSVDKSKRQYGTDGERGTGLGLILCKEFVEKHGGKIWVESEPGKGTKVCFTLPAGS